MKILHIIPSYLPAYHIGGPVKYTHDLCKALAGRKLGVSVFTTTIGSYSIPGPFPFKDNIDGVDITYFPSGPFKRYNYAYGISKAIKEMIQDYDIAHISSVFSYTTFAACSICRKSNTPYILNPFGALDKDMLNLRSALIKKAYIKFIEKKNIEAAAFIHVASDYEKNRLKELGFKNRIEVIPPGLNLLEYNRQDDILRIRYPELKGKKIVLYLGRIHPKKGIGMLLEAFRKVIAQRDDVYLVIAGPVNNAYAKKMISLVNKESILKRRVIFTGILLGAGKTGAFFASDIFILPSYGENFGIAALEALACGLPVLLTKETGLSSDLKESGAGLIFKREVSDISKNIERLISNPDLREAMSSRGRELVRKRFDLEVTVDRMVSLYESIAKRRL